MASGTKFDCPMSAIFLRASSWESRAELQAGSTKNTISKKTRNCFSKHASVASVLTSNKMQVRLLFFATLKDIVGARQMQLDVPAGATIADVLTHLEHSYPRIKDYRPVVLTAINEEYVDQGADVH